MMTRQAVGARIQAAVAVLVILAVIIGPLSYSISPIGDDVIFALGAAIALGVGIAVRTGGRGGAMLGVGVGLVAGCAAALLAGSMKSPGIALLVPPVVGLCIGFMEGVEPPVVRSMNYRVVSSITIGGIIGAGMAAALNWPSLLASVITGLMVGIFAGTRQQSPDGRTFVQFIPALWLQALAFISLAILVALAWNELSWFAIPSILVFALAVPIVAYLIGRWLARWLRPRLQVYSDLVGHFRIMWVPMGGFALGYIALVVVFAGFYGALWRVNPAAFDTAAASMTPLDWLVFSLFTATGQESAGITPAVSGTRLLVGLQTILCLGWMVVVFAAVMAYLQPRFETLGSPSESQRENPHVE